MTPMMTAGLILAVAVLASSCISMGVGLSIGSRIGRSARPASITTTGTGLVLIVVLAVVVYA